MRVSSRDPGVSSQIKNKGRLSELLSWNKSGQEGDHCSVCTCPLASFPLHGSSSPSLALWWGVLHALGRVGAGTEVRFLHFADWAAPRFTGSFGHVVRWLFSFVFRVTLVLIIDVCVERRFICVLAELFLLSFKIFSPGFVFFLNYTNDFFGMCVRDIKAFINLISLTYFFKGTCSWGHWITSCFKRKSPSIGFWLDFT